MWTRATPGVSVGLCVELGQTTVQSLLTSGAAEGTAKEPLGHLFLTLLGPEVLP